MKLSNAQLEALDRFATKNPHTAVTTTPVRTLASLYRRGLISRPFTNDGALRLCTLTSDGEKARVSA